MKRWHVVCLAGLGLTGMILFITTAAFNPIFQLIVHHKMKSMLAVSPQSYSFDFWKQPPVPVFFELYVFDVINPDEVLEGGHPTVVQKGPYTYRVSLEKFNLTFHDNNTVTYRQRQTFVYNRERSVGEENDTFTTINVPMLTVATLVQHEFPWLQGAVNALLDTLDEQPLVQLTVHDIFWGYPDPFLQLVKKLMDKLHLKSKIITGLFGFYMGRNNTDDGVYTVHTGADDLSQFLVIDSWNYQKHLSYWSTDQANMLNGTDGSLYPPFVTEQRTLSMFDSNLLRSMSMDFEEPSSVEGLPTLKFVVRDKEFANDTVNPANEGFCTPRGQCIPSGVLNCSAMGYGAPIYTSLPHFLGADKYYFDLVQGLNPSSQLHRPYFHLHQLTGVCLSAARRYQLNIRMAPYPFLRKTASLTLAYLPVLWINGMAVIDERIKNLFQDEIQRPLSAIMDVHYALYGVGPVLFLIPLLVLFHRKLKAARKNSAEET